VCTLVLQISNTKALSFARESKAWPTVLASAIVDEVGEENSDCDV
jgi:hypothetical protein